MDILAEACHFASEKHRNQRRKNTNKDPYINHPLEVFKVLAKHGVTDVPTLSGGVLHDTVEDTSTTPDELVQKFGSEICQIVLECSDDKSLDKVTRKKVQIEHAKHISDKAKLVKLADKYSNINGLLADPPAKWSEGEITGYVRWGYCVCNNLYGVKGGELLDKLLQELFQKFNVSEVTNEQLEEYYSLIDNSE